MTRRRNESQLKARPARADGSRSSVLRLRLRIIWIPAIPTNFLLLFLPYLLSPSGYHRLFHSVPRDIPRFPLAPSLSACRVESVSVVTVAAPRAPNKYCLFVAQLATFRSELPKNFTRFVTIGYDQLVEDCCRSICRVC